MDITQLTNCPVVQLQLLDELTGEPLEFVNAIGIASKIYMLNGRDVNTVLSEAVEQLQQNYTEVVKSNSDFLKHIHNENALGGLIGETFGKDDPLASTGEGVHAVKELLDKAIIGFKVNKETGVVTFTQYDGQEIVWDTALEHVPTELGWDGDTARFFLKKDGGEIQWIDFARLIDIYRGRTGYGTIDTEVVLNEIRASVREGTIDIKHLTSAVKEYLDESDRFIKAYEDKIKGIEEGANKYILPPAKSYDYKAPEPPEPAEGEEPAEDDGIDKRLGGVIAGPNIHVEEDGTISAVNILYGTDVDTAKPVNILMKVVSSDAPSTSTKPTVTARKSYITSEGNIIIGKDNGQFDYISSSDDGSRQNNLTIDEVNAKMFRGLELIDLDGINWYNDGTYNYAINSMGEGFKYASNSYVFIDYVTNDEFLALIASMNYSHGVMPETPELIQ